MSNLTKDIKLMIFDWSGVISDDRKSVHESNGRMCEAWGIARQDFTSWLRDSTSSAATYFTMRGIVKDPSEIQEIYRTTLEQVKQDGIVPTLYPDAVVSLQKLKQLHEKVFVVSMHPADHIKQEAAGYNLEGLVTGIVGGVKDKVIAIADIIKSTGLSAHEVAYVGDTSYDIQAAKKAGVIAIAITTGYHSREKLFEESPVLIVDSLTELTNYFIS